MFETDLLQNKIIQYYHKNSYLTKFMEIKRRNLNNFYPIEYTAALKSTEFPHEDYLIDDLAENIGKELANQEFSHFVKLMNNIQDNITKTTLSNFVEILENTYNNLWDQGYEINYIFLFASLKNKIRKDLNSRERGLLQLLPEFVIVKELGNDQTIFASKNNFEKIYPKTTNQVEVSVNRIPYHANHTEIHCVINQNLNIRNTNSIARIQITE